MRALVRARTSRSSDPRCLARCLRQAIPIGQLLKPLRLPWPLEVRIDATASSSLGTRSRRQSLEPSEPGSLSSWS